MFLYLKPIFLIKNCIYLVLWLTGFEGAMQVEFPEKMHPKRPVIGLNCPRREV